MNLCVEKVYLYEKVYAIFRVDLAKPASTLYTHNLSGVLEAAIRATNAQFEDPDIIKRLDCRLLEVFEGYFKKIETIPACSPF